MTGKKRPIPAGIVTFAAGARTHWHQHPGGQFLYAVAGRGRVRSRGEAGHVLEAGDVIRVAPGEWHFHGGTPDSPLVHVAVNGGDPIQGPAVPARVAAVADPRRAAVPRGCTAVGVLQLGRRHDAVERHVDGPS